LDLLALLTATKYQIYAYIDKPKIATCADIGIGFDLIFSFIFESLKISFGNINSFL
jgi:hypothetical protein